MDLIYTDKSKTDLGVLRNYLLDLAYGSSENDFELTVSIANNILKDDYLIYAEGTDYGGIVDTLDIDTGQNVIKYLGRTWQGILGSKVIEPPSGSNYRVVNGNSYSVLNSLISLLGLSGLFKAKSAPTVTINNYQFSRYVKGYDGIVDMLAAAGAKLKMNYEDGFVYMWAEPIVVYEDEELDSDHVSFKITKTYNPVNHLVCLGSGELSDRMVIHLYADANGAISQSKTFSGIEEVMQVYDYPNVESRDELLKEGTKKLKELNSGGKVDVSLNSDYEFDIGDKLNVTENVTGISVTKTVTKKIVTINQDNVKVEYTVGEKT